MDITELLKRWDGAWQVDGRPIKNLEMHMLNQWKKEQRTTWRSVATELPDDDLAVLVYVPSRDDPVWLGYHTENGWSFVEGDRCEPTHWMELPQVPVT